MSDVIDIEDRKPNWGTYAIVCGHCGHEWHGVVHSKSLTGLECSKCGHLAGFVHFREAAARYLYWRTANFIGANFMDASPDVQALWRERAGDLFTFLLRGGWRMYASGDKAQMSANGDIERLQAENVRLQTELNVANAIIHDMRHGISSAEIDDLRQALALAINLGIDLGMSEMEVDAIQQRAGMPPKVVEHSLTPHIDRGPGFTHSDPAEECSCRFIGGGDKDAQ